ncbi:hypothetical protein INT48_004207 [Thamnidium elegans]|uniref:F-box domain-containing protein n=1 Tax=Thamnidium elegans TaxID=101142 RepID=A0A8H7SJW4_9FUNG|nr:hypothetical protein INT48_004207 [Thamnidium elegans]
MTFQQLPVEICLQIFRLLPRQTAYNCMFVSKRFYLTAKQAFYFELSLSVNNFLQVYATLIDDSEKTYMLEPWVHTLTIHHERPVRHTHQNIITKFEPNEFVKLLSRLSNLTTIDLRYSINSDYYMSILGDLKQNTLQHIGEIIPGTGSFKLRQSFFQTLYNFNQTLTHLKVEYCDGDITVAGQTGSMISFLPHFKSLTHVSIDNHYDNQLSFTDILNVCPQLVKLNFRSKYDNPEPCLDSMQSFNRLCIIELCIPKFTAAYMDYFMQHIPSRQLNTFKVELQDEEFYGWSETEGIDKIMSFARYMQPVRNFQLYSNNSKTHNEKQVSPSLQEKVTRLFTFIHALKGDKYMNIGAICSDSTSSEVSIEITNGKKLQFSYGIYPNNLQYDDTFISPDKSISIIGYDIICSLSFIITQATEPFGPKLFSYIFSHCPHITDLQINNWNSMCRFELIVKNIKDPVCSQIILKGPTPTQELINLISSRVPRLQVLNCKGFINPKSHIDTKYCLDLTGFTSLKEFSFDIGNILHGVIDSKLLILDFMDEPTMNYYKIDKPLNGNHCSFTETTEQEYNLKTSPFSSNIYFYCHRIHTIHIYAESIEPIAQLRLGKMH